MLRDKADMMVAVLDVFDAGFAAHPWPVLRDLRNDGGVHRIRTPDGPAAWLVTRYEDVRSGLLDDRLSTHVRYATGDDYRGFAVPPPLDVSFLNAEPADHARLRRIVNTKLSQRRLTEWAHTAPDLVASCLESIVDGPVEVITSLAIPLPAAVLGELLGLSEPERKALLDWATTTLMPSPPRPSTSRALAIPTWVWVTADMHAWAPHWCAPSPARLCINSSLAGPTADSP